MDMIAIEIRVNLVQVNHRRRRRRNRI